MTDEILQTDIDLARRLVDAGNGDTEIIYLLARRNIAPDRASRLISDLREGRAVAPDRVWRAIALEGELPIASSASRQTTSSPARARNRPSTPIRVPWFRVLMAAGVFFCIAMAVWIGRQRNERAKEPLNQAGAATPPNRSMEATALQIE